VLRAFDVDESIGRADAIEQMPRGCREQPLERSAFVRVGGSECGR
jgi:hypothetical protein